MRILRASCSSDGNKLLISSGNEVIQIWDKNNHQFQCLTSEFHPSENFIFTQWTNSNTNYLVSYVTSAGKSRFLHYNAITNQLTISKDLNRCRYYEYCAENHSLYIQNSIGKSTDKRIIIEKYDMNTFIKQQAWEFSGDYYCECISYNGQNFVMGYRQYRHAQKHIAHIFSTKSGDIINEIISDEYIFEYRYSPDGNSIIAIGDDKSDKEIMYIYDSCTFECQRKVLDNKYISHTFDIRPDCKQIACADDYSINILDWHTMELVTTLAHNEKWIPLVNYSPDGKRLISATENGTVYIWDTDTYECLQTIPNIPGLFIQGVDLRSLAPGSNFTEEDKHILRMYGALIE